MAGGPGETESRLTRHKGKGGYGTAKKLVDQAKQLVTPPTDQRRLSKLGGHAQKVVHPSKSGSRRGTKRVPRANERRGGLMLGSVGTPPPSHVSTVVALSCAKCCRSGAKQRSWRGRVQAPPPPPPPQSPATENPSEPSSEGSLPPPKTTIQTKSGGHGPNEEGPNRIVAQRVKTFCKSPLIRAAHLQMCAGHTGRPCHLVGVPGLC